MEKIQQEMRGDKQALASLRFRAPFLCLRAQSGECATSLRWQCFRSDLRVLQLPWDAPNDR